MCHNDKIPLLHKRNEIIFVGLSKTFYAKFVNLSFVDM